MPLDALSFLTLVGLTIILGYIGTWIFARTRVPDVIWLMAFGLLVSGLGLIDRTAFVAVSGVMAAVALIIILFDAGLNMNVWKMLKGVPRGTLLAFVVMTISIFAVAGAASFMGFGIIEGLLLGAILASTSTEIVISIVSQLKINEHVHAMLEIESIITDPFVIVITISLIKILTVSTTGVSVVGGIVTAYSVAIVVGLIVGVAWLFVLQRLRGKPYDYMLTIAILALLYVFVESSGGSGAIAALVFGLVLGNAVVFGQALKKKSLEMDGEQMRDFHGQITFFIKAFFFVFIGLIATIETAAVVCGVVISAVLILARLLAVHLSMMNVSLTKAELNLIRIMAPRGLAVAVLAGLPMAYGVPYGENFLNIAFVVILATVIYTTVATRLFYKPLEQKTLTATAAK